MIAAAAPPRKHEATITQEEPPTKNCPTEQRRQLSIAVPAAKRTAERGRAALFSMKNRGVTNFLLHRYFGADAPEHLEEIHAGYMKILDNWGNWELRFDCLLQTEEKCPSSAGQQYCSSSVLSRRWLSSSRYCEDLSTKDAIDNSYARFAQEIFNISL